MAVKHLPLDTLFAPHVRIVWIKRLVIFCTKFLSSHNILSRSMRCIVLVRLVSLISEHALCESFFSSKEMEKFLAPSISIVSSSSSKPRSNI
ncbi:hypothetical protein BpHYR1_038051 [Brachionus plicatilis]|uniref:Uncharacterized protein n=1 Tax=Brachionus plicatilis TaxID=10195 RepID=A0A3M7P406_BRAPC|nr:hypothetical protein BpHYR1_038051 [Brachionus plicatilis]